jgi:hypothetical protein
MQLPVADGRQYTDLPADCRLFFFAQCTFIEGLSMTGLEG